MVFYEFPLVISCILFRSHAKIRQRISSTYGSMRVLLHLYEIIGVPHRPEKDVMFYQRVHNLSANARTKSLSPRGTHSGSGG
jgi:hypothetical protein